MRARRPSAADPQVVTYASNITLEFELRVDPDNAFRPPQLSVTYTHQLNSPDAAAVKVDVTFAVLYSNDKDKAEELEDGFEQFVLATGIVSGFITWAFVMTNYMRRRKNSGQDQTFLLTAFIFFADCISLFLFFALVLVSIYIVILYKLQTSVRFLVPAGEEVRTVRIVCVVWCRQRAAGRWLRPRTSL